MNREIHVRFWESAGVRFPCATQHTARLRPFGLGNSRNTIRSSSRGRKAVAIHGGERSGAWIAALRSQ